MGRSFYWLLVFLSGVVFSLQAEEMMLRDHLKRAQFGDYIVVSSNKTNTLMHIYGKKDNLLTVEEITVPERGVPPNLHWKDWVRNEAPGHTSWVMYDLDLRNGKMARYYSFSHGNWYDIPDHDNFLYKLLNLKLNKISDRGRKRVGPKPTSGPDFRPVWQPKMVVEGQHVKGTTFDAWRAKWPRDGSELSSKTVEVYTAQENDKHPSYFPYWLQINGAVGKAKIRIIDSGRELQSPKPHLSELYSH